MKLIQTLLPKPFIYPFQLFKLFMYLELFIYLSHSYSSHFYTFQTAYSNIYIQVTSISFKKIILENNLYFNKQLIQVPLKRLIKAGQGKWKTSEDSNHTK